ncbi:MAG: type III pantothenate kinase [Deltaproteobacteria bacterium]|nr:type III pantothenate kinase [Deltaproteobacteria bacterium]
MILALDVGNSHIYGGVFEEGIAPALKLQFRKGTRSCGSSDEIGIFLKTALRENGFEPENVRQIAVCSVVPDVIHSLRGACSKYFGINPFILQSGVKTGLKIKYKNPIEVGADRIASAIAATHHYPGKNLIVVDYGTATTFCAINSDKDYLGGVIMPGFRISMEALESETARLPSVEIVAPEEVVARSTVESIQSGLYYGNLYALKGITDRIKRDHFAASGALVIGTGGFSRLFEGEKIFDVLVPELVLNGLYLALKMNA